MIVTNFFESGRFCTNITRIVLFTFLSLAASCVTQRDVEYLQDQNVDIKKFDDHEFPDYKLKSNDELYIQVNSLDEAAANIFSNATRQTYSLDPYAASLLSYSIDKDGYLILPVIGKILAKDKTLSQVSMILRDSLHHILNQPVVTVKLVNRYVSVLGEVRNPGHYPYSQEKLSIFDAVGMAGDVTDYGNRDKAILIRNDNGENVRVNINLTSSDILTSEYYYLRPNDIVYIKPLREKFWGLRQFPWSVFFAAITTGLLIYEVVNPN
jgi:polysaccharide biosynthesis/export protein